MTSIKEEEEEVELGIRNSLLKQLVVCSVIFLETHLF